ncbi:chlorohydrolase [Streptococcus pneumoniae]|nr:chlorohydrolase [Streptococcus pneumoniae]
MEIKEQTRNLAAGCSKHCFEVADGSWFEEIFEEYKSMPYAFRLP